jgi:hypothetical protein
MLLALALAAAEAAPQPGALRLFQDWTVGCDNGRSCQAVALLPEGQWDWSTMVVRRAANADAPPELFIVPADGGKPAAAEASGTRVPLTATDEGFSPSDPKALIALLRTAPELALVDAAGKTISRVSLKGASAALLYIDDQQKRVGTQTAMVRPGRAPARIAVPPLPVIAQPPRSAAAPPRLDRAGLLRAHVDTGCDRIAKPEDVTIARLDAASTLVLLPDWCGSGAYNFTSVALIADNRGRVRPARFETPPGFQDDNLIVNGDWLPDERRLTSYAKGRGIGDCGSAQEFAWDGTRFRLTEMTLMGECRGSLDWITTWRAVTR